jgi:hypothetical protein
VLTDAAWGEGRTQVALSELRDPAVAAQLCRHVHFHGMVVVTLDDASRRTVAAGLAAARAFFAHTPPAAKNALRCKSFQGYTTPKPVRRQLHPSTGLLDRTNSATQGSRYPTSKQQQQQRRQQRRHQANSTDMGVGVSEGDAGEDWCTVCKRVRCAVRDTYSIA